MNLTIQLPDEEVPAIKASYPERCVAGAISVRLKKDFVVGCGRRAADGAMQIVVQPKPELYASQFGSSSQ